MQNGKAHFALNAVGSTAIVILLYQLLVAAGRIPANAAVWTCVGISAVLMFTVAGMAVGGWLSGVIYDLSGGYQAAFLNGIAWNIFNVAIALELIRRSTGTRRMGMAAA